MEEIKKTIPLKFAISSAPKAKQEFVKSVDKYNQDVREYKAEKKRIDEENARREREYQKQLDAYNRSKKGSSRRAVYETVVTTTTKDTTPKVSTRADDITPEIFKLASGGFSFIESLGKNTSVVKKTIEPDETDKLYSKIFVGYTPSTKYSSISTPKPKAPTILSTPVKSDFIGLIPVLNQQNKERLAEENKSLGRYITDEAKRSFLSIVSLPSKITKAGIEGAEVPFSTKSQNLKRYSKISKDFLVSKIPKTKEDVLKTSIQPYIVPTLKSEARVNKVLNYFKKDLKAGKEKAKADFELARNSKGTILSQLKKDIKTPETKKQFAESLVGATTMASPILISKGYNLTKGLYYSKFGTKVPAELLYSEKALKSPIGIDTSFNPEKTIKLFKESPEALKKANIPELAKAYEGKLIGVSSAPKPLSGKKILSKLELNDNYLKETGGLFMGPLKAGQPKFLGLQNTEGYSFTLNPFKALTSSKPTQYTIGVKSVKEFPSRFLSKDNSILKEIEKYQRSRVGKGEVYITRESSLGMKTEPEVVGNVGDFIKNLKTSKPLYTVVNGKTVPVKPIDLVIKPTNPALKVTDDFTSSVFKDKSIEQITPKKYSQLTGEAYKNYYKPSITLPYGSFPSIISSNKSKTSSVLSSKDFSSSSKASFDFIDTKEPVYNIPKYPSYETTSSTETFKSYITEPSSSLPYPTAPSYLNYPVFKTKEPILSTTIKIPTTSLYSRKSLSSKSNKSNINLSKPYKIQIRSFGKWKDIKEPVKRNYFSAFNRGSEIVDNFKERSFRLKPTSGTVTNIQNSFSMRKSKFYQPAKSKNLTSAYVEKSKFAIDSINELRGITYKGLKSIKRKYKK
jgi:hypothetical protein